MKKDRLVCSGRITKGVDVKGVWCRWHPKGGKRETTRPYVWKTEGAPERESTVHFFNEYSGWSREKKTNSVVKTGSALFKNAGEKGTGKGGTQGTI